MLLPGQIIRPAAVAGKFYPAHAGELERLVEGLMEAAHTESVPNPKAVLAPHAGYVFSGPIAGSAFRAWSKQCRAVRRVVLVGPSHYVAFRGIALPHATAFGTPLGAGYPRCMNCPPRTNENTVSRSNCRSCSD